MIGKHIVHQGPRMSGNGNLERKVGEKKPFVIVCFATCVLSIVGRYGVYLRELGTRGFQKIDVKDQ